MSVKTLSTALLACLLVVARPLVAACPRTGGEITRRVVPEVLLFPYGLLMLRHDQTRVPMPPAGVRARVSHDTPNGLRFTEGTYRAALDSAFQLAMSDGDIALFPLARTRCLQVFRRSRPIGATVGMGLGGVAGLIAGGVIGGMSHEPWALVGGAFLGGAIGSVGGAIIGGRRGAAAWDVAWERPR